MPRPRPAACPTPQMSPRPAACRLPSEPRPALQVPQVPGAPGPRPAGCPRAGAPARGAHLHAGFCSSSAPERARTGHKRGVHGGQRRRRAEPSHCAPVADCGCVTPVTPSRALSPKPQRRGGPGDVQGRGGVRERAVPRDCEAHERASVCHLLQNLLGEKRLSSLRALIFMRHGNFDTEKVSVTFSCVRIFYFSRKLQSSNDLINVVSWPGLEELSVWACRACQAWGSGWAAGEGGDSHPRPGGGGLPSWGGAFPHSF